MSDRVAFLLLTGVVALGIAGACGRTSDEAPYEIDAALGSPVDGAIEAHAIDATVADAFNGLDVATEATSGDASDAGSDTESDVVDASDAIADADAGADVAEADAAACGDGIIGPTEDCDDRNGDRLDGCDPGCRYEVLTRVTSLSIQGTPAPAFCTPSTNRLGAAAFSGAARSTLNNQLQSAINGGSSLLLTMHGLDDATGESDPDGLAIGILGAEPDPARGTWPGGAPIDWWFLGASSMLDPTGMPTGMLTNGALDARVLTAGPTDLDFPFAIGAGTGLRMRSARLTATIDDAPPPNAPAPPPDALRADFTVFRSLRASGAQQGLCGNVTVASLAQIPLPRDLAAAGASACGACAGSKQYTYCGDGAPVGPGCNSLLDAIVGGCKTAFCFVTVIAPQQPDVSGTDGDVDALTLGPANKIADDAIDGNDDAYSLYLKFEANRAHLTGRTGP